MNNSANASVGDYNMKLCDTVILPPDVEIVSNVFTGRVKIELVEVDKGFWFFRKKSTKFVYLIERLTTFKRRDDSVDSIKDFYYCSRKDYIKYINNEKFMKVMGE